MKKVHRKPPEEREVKYLQFKSYHGRVSKTESKTDDCQISSKEKKNRKVTTSHRISGYKGDTSDHVPEEADGTCGRELKLADAFRHLESENASLKLSLQSMITPTSYERLKIELEQSENQRSRLQQDVLDLQRNNDALSTTVVELKEKSETLQHDNEELEDRLELVCDKVKYFSDANDSKEHQLEELLIQVQKLQSELNSALSTNEELSTSTMKLSNEVADLQSTIDKKNRKMEAYQAKCESSKTKLEHAMLEKEQLEKKIATDSKFVELMEADLLHVKQTNAELVEKNNLLTKQVTEMKKITEQLRQKYDELKKANKLLKEKETRYFAHDRISVGKYVAKIPSMPDRDVRDLCSVTSLQLGSTNYPRKQKQEKSINERLFKILHRADSSDRKPKTRN